jgi:hypothetical protein
MVTKFLKFLIYVSFDFFVENCIYIFESGQFVVLMGIIRLTNIYVIEQCNELFMVSSNLQMIVF